MVQHFHRDGLKLVIAAIGIEQIVRHHGIQVGAREGQSDAVKRQQGRLQIMDHLGSRRVVQQRNDGPHVGSDVERNERGLVSRRQRHPLHIRLHTWPRGEQTLQAEDAALRQSLHKSLRGRFILNELRLNRIRLGLCERRLK